MLRINRNALICDFAETYHIYDYRSLSASQAAALAVGLRTNSRIKTIMRGIGDGENDLNDLLLAFMCDLLSLLALGTGKIPSMVEMLTSNTNNTASGTNGDENKFMVFDSPEEFDAARKKILTED